MVGHVRGLAGTPLLRCPEYTRSQLFTAEAEAPKKWAVSIFPVTLRPPSPGIHVWYAAG